MATSVTLKPNAIDISGSTSGTTTLQASAVAGTTTLTLPAATDTLVGKATTDTLTNKTLTGAAMNGTLGATTPSTASVTTLTTSSTVTHSGGTANGVAYLDGSKVLTTGSALTYDGTNLTVNTGTVSATYGKLTVAGGISITPDSSSKFQIGRYSAGAPYSYIKMGSTSSGLKFTDPADSVDLMTLDSSGNLLVGTTSQSASERFNATNSAANSQAIIANATSSSFNGDVVLVRAARNTTNSTFAAFSYYNDGAAAYKLRIWDSGNVVNTNNSYGAISDAKLKENIVDATPKLEKLNQVRVVNFNFIGDQQKQLGVVAQELEQIFPSMIDESPDKDAEGNDLGTTTKSVKYSVFVPMLIKAIQEQQAIIQSLTDRITALESA